MSDVYLLDTHALIWSTAEPDRLSHRVAEIIKSRNNRILVSVATLWELSIKRNIGKIDLPESFFEQLFDLGYTRLGIEDRHLKVYRSLPLYHRDPFDRLLVAQAHAEQIVLLSHDEQVLGYDVDVLW